METLSNSILTVQIAEHGAELQSIKKDGKEYLWQGDAKFWGRRSPVLFPIVGRVWIVSLSLSNKNLMKVCVHPCAHMCVHILFIFTIDEGTS